MSQQVNREGSVSIFLLVVIVLGAVSGAVAGGILDGVVADRRLLALLAALLAVLVVGLVRRFLGETYPGLFLTPTRSPIPVNAWLVIVISALIGGFAGHDLSDLARTSAGIFVGLFSGTLAAVSMATLVLLYFRRLLRDV
jgi:hypothetical protein